VSETFAVPVRPGTLLDGRVVHAQPEAGHRSGIEPVLLAATVPAKAGERVLEGGSGAGAALLCLAYRQPEVAGVGVELDPALAALARRNAAANGFARLTFAAADITCFAPEGMFDHAMANPPWHVPTATPSPDATRERARRASPGLIAAWTAAIARPVRVGGSVTLVVGAGVMGEAMAALSGAGCGSLALLPLWPRGGVAAKLVLVRGIKAGRGPSRMLAGLVLHQTDGSYTEAVRAVLGQGAPLDYCFDGRGVMVGA
jgi:tRNA1Val (adenine37-N6)-methyltransferase